MPFKRRPWQEELAIIDRTMKAVSGITDPNELVEAYWDGVGELMPSDGFISLSRRGVEPPNYLITRSSRFAEDYNPWTQRDKLPLLSGGILGEIIYADKPMVIEDLTSRLAPDDPAHFYLEGFGCLVALPNYDSGKGINASVALFKPGIQLDYSVLPMMHWQANLFGRGTQNLVLRNQLKSALTALDRELQVVGEIQRSLLPQELPEIPGFEVAAFYQTSARAGGDYYDFFPLGDRAWGAFIADVSGHGTPAAVLMAVTHAIAHTRPGPPKPPGHVLAHLDRHLAGSYTTSGAFVTAFYAALDPDTRRLTYSSAGHNPPRLLRSGRILSLDKGGGMPLGISGTETYPDATLSLEPGDLLVLYTDGITEAAAPSAPNAPRDLFGVERLDRLLISADTLSAQACIERICAEVAAFTAGARPTDDQTLVVLRCLP